MVFLITPLSILLQFLFCLFLGSGELVIFPLPFPVRFPPFPGLPFHGSNCGHPWQDCMCQGYQVSLWLSPWDTACGPGGGVEEKPVPLPGLASLWTSHHRLIPGLTQTKSSFSISVSFQFNQALFSFRGEVLTLLSCAVQSTFLLPPTECWGYMYTAQRHCLRCFHSEPPLIKLQLRYSTPWGPLEWSFLSVVYSRSD